jgi:hypothetical protein
VTLVPVRAVTDVHLQPDAQQMLLSKALCTATERFPQGPNGGMGADAHLRQALIRSSGPLDPARMTLNSPTNPAAIHRAQRAPPRGRNSQWTLSAVTGALAGKKRPARPTKSPVFARLWTGFRDAAGPPRSRLDLGRERGFGDEGDPRKVRLNRM